MIKMIWTEGQVSTAGRGVGPLGQEFAKPKRNWWRYSDRLGGGGARPVGLESKSQKTRRIINKRNKFLC